MKNVRLERINSEIRKAISEIIDQELRDPQINAMIGVSSVEITPDLANAKVFITSMGATPEEEVIERIKNETFTNNDAKMVLLSITDKMNWLPLKPNKTSKKVFQILDHCSIFILIAGSYTPVALCTIREVSPFYGWLIFGLVWGAAAIGIALNAIDLKTTKVFSMICYLLMGWCIIFKFDLFMQGIHINGVWLMLAGGIAYTIGAILYGIGRTKKYFHSIFHLFIVLASLLQFLSILLYIM